MKNNVQRVIIVTVASVLMILGLLKTTPTTAQSSAITLRVVGSLDDPDFKVAVDKYQKANPTITIQVISSTWGPGGRDMRDKELVLLSSGDPIDVGKMVWSKEFFSKGVTIELPDEVKTWDVYKAYTPGQLERITLGGKIVSLTAVNNSIFLWYNKDILSKVGVTDPPKTLDDLLAIAKKIKDANLQTADGKTIYTVNFEGGNWATDYWLWANGGTQMNADFSKTMIDSPDSIKAFTFMQDMVKNGYAPKIDGSYDQGWLNGQLAFFTCGNWCFDSTTKAKINYGTAVMPTGSSGTNTVSIGGIEYGIFKQSQHQKEALDFLKTMLSVDDQLDPANTTQPTTISLYDNPAKQSVWKQQGSLDMFLTQKAQLASTHYNFLEAPFVFPDASQLYSDAIERILVKLDDPTTVLTDTAKQINQGIADASAQ